MRRLGVLACALLGLACAAATKVVAPDSDVTLSVGQQVEIATTDVVLSVQAITADSRCPIDVVCVHAGNGRVEVRVRSGGEERTLSLNTNEEPHAAVFREFELRLVNLAPAPVSTRRIEQSDYRVTLRVSRTD